MVAQSFATASHLMGTFDLHALQGTLQKFRSAAIKAGKGNYEASSVESRVKTPSRSPEAGVMMIHGMFCLLHVC